MLFAGIVIASPGWYPVPSPSHWVFQPRNIAPLLVGAVADIVTEEPKVPVASLGWPLPPLGSKLIVRVTGVQIA